jgi:nucleoside-diphosphate-sugar epimerase
MILVTTAGKVGAETAHLLAQRGGPVRVLVRVPEKAAAGHLVKITSKASADSPIARRRGLDPRPARADLRAVRHRPRPGVLVTLAGARTQSHSHPAVNVTITTQHKEPS